MRYVLTVFLFLSTLTGFGNVPSSSSESTFKENWHRIFEQPIEEEVFLPTLQATEGNKYVFTVNAYHFRLSTAFLNFRFHKNPNVIVFTVNAIGSVVANTDQDGFVIRENDFDAYGNIVNEIDLTTDNFPAGFGGSTNDLLFSTKERDFSTGLDYFGFRYYDPILGKFTTRDPSGYPDGPNNYLYVNNNPINSIDPLGLKKADWDNPEWHHLIKNDKRNRDIFKDTDLDFEEIRDQKENGIIMRKEDHTGKGEKSIHHGSDFDDKIHEGLKDLKDKDKLTKENIRTLVDEIKSDKKYSKWIDRSIDATMDYGDWKNPKAAHGKNATEVRKAVRAKSKQLLKELHQASQSNASSQKMQSLRGAAQKLLKGAAVMGVLGTGLSASAIANPEVLKAYENAIKIAKTPGARREQVENAIREVGIEVTIATGSHYGIIGAELSITIQQKNRQTTSDILKDQQRIREERGDTRSRWQRIRDDFSELFE